MAEKRINTPSHSHIWLRDRIKADQIDSVFSSELPDAQRNPCLHEIIVKNMIHGPCTSVNMNSPCVKDGKCTKRYPRQLIHDTQTGDGGYSLYRRRT
jgi:hypothetical protein